MFWRMAYKYGWCTIEQLLQAVKTPMNPSGEISEEEYKEITGFVFPNTK